MSRPRPNAATVLAKTVPFLTMANGFGAKLCRMTVLHCALVLAKMVVSVQQNAERISFGKRISFWLMSDHWFGRRPCSVRAVREILFNLVAVLATELPFSAWQKNYLFIHGKRFLAKVVSADCASRSNSTVLLVL